MDNRCGLERALNENFRSLKINFLVGELNTEAANKKVFFTLALGLLVQYTLLYVELGFFPYFLGNTLCSVPLDAFELRVHVYKLFAERDFLRGGLRGRLFDTQLSFHGWLNDRLFLGHVHLTFRKARNKWGPTKVTAVVGTLTPVVCASF